MSEPTTAEGRALLAREDYNSRSFALITPEAIAAIEAAAAEAERVRERARIRALGPEFRRVITNAYYDTRNEGGTMETAADRAVAAVLAAIDGPTPDRLSTPRTESPE